MNCLVVKRNNKVEIELIWSAVLQSFDLSRDEILTSLKKEHKIAKTIFVELCLDYLSYETKKEKFKVIQEEVGYKHNINVYNFHRNIATAEKQKDYQIKKSEVLLNYKELSVAHDNTLIELLKNSDYKVHFKFETTLLTS